MNAVVLEHFNLYPDSSATRTEAIPEPCDKCQHTSCFALHDYSASNCPFQTCNECTELENLDAQVSEAHNLLISLSKKRNSLKERINCRHDRFTSLLPVEVVSYIFLFAADSNPNQYTEKNQSNTPAPLLGAVCRRWREITLRLPQLWMRVSVNPYKHSSSPDITEKWLSRSGALPLYLEVRGNTVISSFSIADLMTPPLTTFIKLLRLHSGRWKELVLQVPFYIVHGLFNNLDHTHNLKTLTITDVVDGRPTMDPITMKNPIAVESLCATRFSLGGLSFDWDKLTQFTAQSLSVDEVVHVFVQARNLHSAVVNYTYEDAGHYPLPASPVTNSSVKELDNSEGNLLHHLTLPSLEILKHRVSDYSDPMVGMNALADFVNRSQPPLLDFTISYCVDLPEYTNDWYSLFPTLTRLELDLDFVETEVERVQGYIGGLDASLVPLAFPRLRALEITVNDMCPESWRRLARIFPDDDGEENNDSESDVQTVKRPLMALIISMRRAAGEDLDEGSGQGIMHGIMDDETYYRLIAIQDSGVDMKIFNPTGMDLMGSDTSSESDHDENDDDAT